MANICPVTYELACEAKNTVAVATSLGSPTLPIGVRLTTLFLYSSFFKTCFAKSVFMYHGAIAFTRIPSLPHSQAKLFVNWFNAAFDIAYIAPV